MKERNEDLIQVQKMLLKSMGPILIIGIIAGGCHIFNDKACLTNKNKPKDHSSNNICFEKLTS